MISILIASEGQACPSFIFVSQKPAQCWCLRQVATRIISRACLYFLLIIPFPFLTLKMLCFSYGAICKHRGQKIIRGCAVFTMCLSNAVKRKHISKIPTFFVSAILLASVSLVLLPHFCHSRIRLCLLVEIFKARQFYQHPYLLLNGYLRCYFLAAYLMGLRSEAL